MTDRPLRVAIAGANAERGWARDAHVPALKAMRGITIHAVSARTQELADRAAETFGAERAFGDTLAMVRDPQVDIVAVTCKVPEHRAIVLAAIAAGKHLYCEWPLGRTVGEAREMVEAADRAGVHAAIGLQGAVSPAVRHAARLAAEGAIGKLLNLRVVSSTAGWGSIAPPFYAYLQDKRNGATLSTIAGGHTLAMVEAVAGAFTEIGSRNSILRETVEIAGTGEKVTRTCPDHVLIHGRHESGCVSSVEIVGGEDRPLSFELRGTDGTLEITGHHPGGYQCAQLSAVTNPASDEQPSPSIPAIRGQAANVSEVYSLLENDIRNSTRTAPDFRRAAKLAQLLEDIDAAAESGCLIRRS